MSDPTDPAAGLKTDRLTATPPPAAAPTADFTESPPRFGAVGLGHYDVLETVGRGGYGVVVKAFDRKLHRAVAIKMMCEEMAATSPARRRFVREARAAAAVRHPNVVQIHAVEERPVPHLVMEFVPGGSLQQHLDRHGPLAPADVLRIAAQVARGLAAAHAQGLVHRDIKPANILLESADGLRVKITDFGLARAADDASLSQSGTVAGTPMYMAPEQARGEAVDHRSDLFSLGSVLYAMACGHPPFRAANTLAVLKRVGAAVPRPIREVVPETPDWLCAIIARLHAREPADRYPSAAAVVDVLERCLADLERGVTVRTPPPVRPRRAAAVAAGLLLVTGVSLGMRPAADPVRAVPPAAVAAPAIGGFRNAVGMEFVRLPAGRSVLGSAAGPRPVELPYDFYLGKYEVTRADWEAVMGPGTDPSRFARTGPNATAVADVPDAELRRFPVEGVTWNDCQEFVRQLNRLVPEPGWVYRLPTSTEWEYACRNGPGRSADELRDEFFAGDPSAALGPDRANVRGGPGRPVPVGSYPPNRLGLHDLHGNVFEYLDDFPAEDPGSRLLVGGFWTDAPAQCRAVHRGWSRPDVPRDGAGLRIARVPSGPAATTARELFEDVVSDLRRLNPKLTAPFTPTVTDDRVTGLAAAAAPELRDISPLRRLRHLRSLALPFSGFADLGPLRGLPLRELNTNNNTSIRDLGPLAGMRLESVQLWGFQGGDLSPLRGMPVRELNVGCGPALRDLSPLRGMPLEALCLNLTPVEDLSPLAGLPLKELLVEGTRVTDLSPVRGLRLRKFHGRGGVLTDLGPLRGHPLEELTLDFDPARDAAFLRAVPTLKRVNDGTAAEFWAAVSAGRPPR